MRWRAFIGLAVFATFHYWVPKTWLSDFRHGRRFGLKWPWLAAARPAPLYHARGCAPLLRGEAVEQSGAAGLRQACLVAPCC